MDNYYEGSIVFLIEPYYVGLQFIDVCKEINCQYVIIRRDNGPYLDSNFGEIIVVDIYDITETINAISKKLSEKKYERVAILAGTDFCVDIVAQINQKLGLKSNSEEAAIGSRNKLAMRKILKENNVLCPNFQHFNNLHEIKTYKKGFDYPLVIKPTDMAGSAFVTLINNFDELVSSAEQIFSINNNILNYNKDSSILIEEYITGEEFSVELVLSDGNTVFSSITEKCKGSLPHFIEFGHIVPPRSIADSYSFNIIECAKKAAGAIGIIHGPAHVEIIYTSKGPSVVEVASRMGGDNIMKLTQYSTGIYIPKLVIDLTLGLDIESNNNVSKGGSAIKYLECLPGKIVDINIDDKIKCNENLLDIHLDVKEGDYVKRVSSSYDRIGYIMTVGVDGKEAYDLACELASGIEIKTVIH